MFSTSKTISVASVIYNMAGDIEDSNIYIKSSVLSSVLNNTSVSQAIVDTALNGAYIKKNRLVNWTKRHNFGGNIITSLDKHTEIDLNVLYDYITVSSDEFITIEKAYIELTDIAVFTDNYLLINDPDKRFTNWVATYLPDPNRVKITYENNTFDIFNLPSNFEFKKEYLVAYYSVYKNDYSGSLITGDIINSNDLPDTSDYNEISNIITDTDTVTLNVHTHIKREYSNSTPTSNTDSYSTTTDTFNKRTKIKENNVYLGSVDNEEIKYNLYTYTEYLDYTIEDNVTETVDIIDHGSYIETVTTTVTNEYLANDYSYRINTQLFISNELVDTRMLIYKLNSGNVELDSLLSNNTIFRNEFYPIIPLRINNTSVKNIPSTFTDISKAYKIMAEENINKILDKINDNPDINDIDYVYTYIGISLNSTNKTELKYIYNFFKNLIPYQGVTFNDYLEWVNKSKKSKEYEEIYDRWLLEQKTQIIFETTVESNSYYIMLNEYYNEDIPTYIFPKNLGFGRYTWYGSALPLGIGSDNSAIGVKSPTKPTLKLKTNNTLNDNFYMYYSWFNIKEEVHTGVSKPNVKVGEYWWDVPNNTSQPYLYWDDIYRTGVIKAVSEEDTDGNSSINQARISLYYQIDNNSYRVLHIDGLEQRNYVYEDKFVLTIGKEVIKNKTNKDFIVPLHLPTLKSLSIIEKNELVLKSHNLVFNVYQINKKRWYQSGLFTAILVIAIVVIAIYTGGTSGIFTSTLAVGIASTTGISLAVAGIIAFLVTSGISMVIAIVLVKTLQLGFEQFVDKDIAKLLATITAIVVTYGYSSYTAASSTSILDMLSIENLNSISNALAGTNFLNQYNSILQTEVNELSTQYDTILKQINKNNEELGLINTDISLTQNTILEYTSNNNVLLNEAPIDFINRTTLTGSEIINIQRQAINDYVNLTLNSYKL